MKRIDSNAPPHLGSIRSLHLPTSQTAPSPLSTEIIGSVSHLSDNHPREHGHPGHTDRPLKVIVGYSHPKDHQIEAVEECESNDQLCSSGKAIHNCINN